MKIEPITLIDEPGKPQVFTEAQVGGAGLTFDIGSSIPAWAIVTVGTLDAKGNFIPSKFSWPVQMNKAQYAGWGENDKYAVQTFIENAGLVPVE